jgi:hypothetical protein
MNRNYRKIFHLALAGAIFTFLLHPVHSRAQEGADANQLLQAVLEKSKKGEESKTRLTCKIHAHQTNFNEKGKKTADFTQLSELIYLSDLPYIRRLEFNEKPLSGKALAEENQRYEAAVAEHKGLSENQRAERAGGKSRDVTIRLGKLLTVYDNRIRSHEAIGGHNCLVIDSTPRPAAADAPKRHVVLWIDPNTLEMIKLAFDLTADEDDLLKGSSGWILMETIHGVSVDTASHIDYLLPIRNRKKDVYRVVTDSTMTGFRLFATTVRIDVPDESAKQ